MGLTNIVSWKQRILHLRSVSKRARTSEYQNKYPLSEGGKNELEKRMEIAESKNQIKFCNCDWFEFLPFLNDINPTDHYIFLSSKQFLNCYDFANMLQVNLHSNCYFAWGITDLSQAVHAKSYYNLFSNIV